MDSLKIIAAVLAYLLLWISPAYAVWVDIPIINPGAETGDLTGWTGPDFSAENLGSDAHDGDWSFSSTGPEFFTTLTQTIEIVPGSASDLKVSAWFKTSEYGGLDPDYIPFKRIGYDVETDQEYTYYAGAILQWLWYAGGSYVYGFGRWAPYSTDWEETAMITDESWINAKWLENRDAIDRIDLVIELTYSAFGDSDVPDEQEIDEWRGWYEDEIPVFAADSVSLQFEPVPAPGALLLLASGIIGALAVRRARAM